MVGTTASSGICYFYVYFSFEVRLQSGLLPLLVYVCYFYVYFSFEVRLRSGLLPLLVHVILMFISVLKFAYSRDYCLFWYMLF